MQRQSKSTFAIALSAFLIFSLALMFFNNFHTHWVERAQRAKRARLYLDSDVCTNHRLRIQLGPEATCAQKEMELRVAPIHRAVFDTLEDYSLCGHRRCEAMVQWVLHWKWLFLALVAGRPVVLRPVFRYGLPRAQDEELAGAPDSPRRRNGGPRPRRLIFCDWKSAIKIMLYILPTPALAAPTSSK